MDSPSKAGCKEKPLPHTGSQAAELTGCTVSVLEQPGLTSELASCWAGGWTGSIPRFPTSTFPLFCNGLVAPPN